MTLKVLVRIINRILKEEKKDEKNIIEISDSEKLVLFEFLNRIINDKYDELSGDLFEDISEEHVLSTILCQLI